MAGSPEAVATFEDFHDVDLPFLVFYYLMNVAAVNGNWVGDICGNPQYATILPNGECFKEDTDVVNDGMSYSW